jgi:predicted AAA+ superfamily ATPase
MLYKNRTIENAVRSVSKNFKAVLVTGMRRVGKTTLLRRTEDRRYVTLDNPKDLLFAKTEPELFLKTYRPPLLIDEIQYAPELFRYLKMQMDSAAAKGSVWLTGSQQYSLMQGVSESLAGRLAILNLFGFSIYERANQGLQQKPFLPAAQPASLLAKKSPQETCRLVWQGAYPEITAKDSETWNFFYSSYIKTYLERDVRQIGGVGNELTFMRFLSVAAARTGQELNLTDLARNADIAPNTAKQWLSILETSGIIYLLRPYYKNVTKRLVKRPKLYFTDTGLCAYLTESTPESLASGPLSGAFFETFVIMEILKSYQHNGLFPALYYYRDSNQVEIDLLIKRNELFHPVEIKKTTNPQKSDIAAFARFAELEKTGYGSLICLTDQARPLTRRANAISIWDI